jgi:hypothetical protein
MEVDRVKGKTKGKSKGKDAKGKTKVKIRRAKERAIPNKGNVLRGKD